MAGLRSWLGAIRSTLGAGEEPLYRRIPRGLLEFGYVAILLAAVDLSINGAMDWWVLEWRLQGDQLVPIPPGMYVFATIGAGAYVATSLIFEPKDDVVEVKRLGYRMVAALPLAAGVYLLASFILGPDVGTGGQPDSVIAMVGSNQGLAGLAFLAGLFVRLTLRKLADVAETVYNIGDVRNSPHEKLERREKASSNLRKAWRELSVDPSTPRAVRDESRELLRRAETILEDEDATLQQLDRAVELSQQALSNLESSTERMEDDAGPGPQEA